MEPILFRRFRVGVRLCPVACRPTWRERIWAMHFGYHFVSLLLHIIKCVKYIYMYCIYTVKEHQTPIAECYCMFICSFSSVSASTGSSPGTRCVPRTAEWLRYRVGQFILFCGSGILINLKSTAMFGAGLDITSHHRTVWPIVDCKLFPLFLQEKNSSVSEEHCCPYAFFIFVVLLFKSLWCQRFSVWGLLIAILLQEKGDWKLF